MKWRTTVALALVAGAVRADAFVRTTDSTTQVCLYWATRNLPWSLNEKGSNDPPFDTLPPIQAALQRSFDTWQNNACTDLTFHFMGTTPRTDVGYDPSSSTNINLLIWREVSCDAAAPANDSCHDDDSCGNKYDCWDHSSGVIALTTTNYDRDSGELVDADIEFNGSPDKQGHEFRFTATEGTTPICGPNDGPQVMCVSTDVQNTATHEIGHFVGLAHSPVPDSTMFASASPGETKKRTLSQDDIDGLCAIYPRGKPPNICPPTNASVGAPSGTTMPAPSSCGCGPGPGGLLAMAGLLLGLRRRRSVM